MDDLKTCPKSMETIYKMQGEIPTKWSNHLFSPEIKRWWEHANIQKIWKNMKKLGFYKMLLPSSSTLKREIPDYHGCIHVHSVKCSIKKSSLQLCRQESDFPSCRSRVFSSCRLVSLCNQEVWLPKPELNDPAPASKSPGLLLEFSTGAFHSDQRLVHLETFRNLSDRDVPWEFGLIGGLKVSGGCRWH